MPAPQSLDQYLHRRIKPLKVLASMLTTELRHAAHGAGHIQFSVEELDDMLSTIEDFIADFERVSNVPKTPNMRGRILPGPHSERHMPVPSVPVAP